MTEEQIVDKVSEIMDMRFSHYDNHKMRKDYFQEIDELESIPKIVQYGSSYGHWQFSILEDMSIITTSSSLHSIYIEMKDTLESKGIDIPADENHELMLKHIENIKKAEKFLKDNNCSEVINDPNKKINWV